MSEEVTFPTTFLQRAVYTWIDALHVTWPRSGPYRHSATYSSMRSAPDTISLEPCVINTMVLASKKLSVAFFVWCSQSGSSILHLWLQLEINSTVEQMEAATCLICRKRKVRKVQA